MKYEMIFGDEALFDGAPWDSVCVERFINHELVSVCVHYRTIDALLNTLIEQEAVSCASNRPDIAIRRIIKEPKRWTVEDKKAGRLPEVGSRIFVPLMQEEQNVIYTSKNVIISISDSDGAVTRTEVKSIDRINPIETPAEKAQRLEDEFVKSEMKDTTLSIEWACVYERGVRAAYRRLSGDLPMPVKDAKNEY